MYQIGSGHRDLLYTSAQHFSPYVHVTRGHDGAVTNIFRCRLFERCPGAQLSCSARGDPTAELGYPSQMISPILVLRWLYPFPRRIR